MNSQPRNTRRLIRNLVIFTIAVLACGWLGHGLNVLTESPASEGPGMLLWISAPLGVSLALRAVAGDGWKDMGWRPNVKRNAGWYLIALLVYPVLTVVVLIIGYVSGLITFPGLSMHSLVLLLQAFALGIVPQFIKNILEEAAWRGYLAPKIALLRLNDLTGHVIVGLIWGAWHIPYYLFFLERSVLERFTALSVLTFIPVSIAVMIAWATVYGEIRLLTGSFWPAVLMHLVEDAFLNELFTGHHISIMPGTDWIISPVNGVISIFFFLAVGVGLRGLRKRRYSFT